MKQSIGGYFGLELQKGAKQLHTDALLLNSARNCLEYVLRVRKYQKVYIPYYTCKVILEPLEKLGVCYEFYRINEYLEPQELPMLGKEDAFLYTNYFGLKQECVERLYKHLGIRLIVDNSQALYARPLEGVDTFYSPRKFVGVADGGVLYCDEHSLYDELPQDQSWNRMSHLLKRTDVSPQFGFEDFHKNDDSLIGLPLMRMSKLTETILSSFDYEQLATQRRDNYELLSKELGYVNGIDFPITKDAVPMVYPYWTNDTNLRQRLIANQIFVAQYWPNVLEWCTPCNIEYQMANNIIPLPIDQRYGVEEMNRIIEIFKCNSI